MLRTQKYQQWDVGKDYNKAKRTLDKEANAHSKRGRLQPGLDLPMIYNLLEIRGKLLQITISNMIKAINPNNKKLMVLLIL